MEPADPDADGEGEGGGGLVDVITAGAVLATLVAGWPLYSLVTSGSLDGDTALLRGGVVVAACAAGVLLVVRLARGYEAAAAAERKARLDALFSDMEDAVSAGTLTPEGPPRPASAGDAGPTDADAPPAV